MRARLCDSLLCLPPFSVAPFDSTTEYGTLASEATSRAPYRLFTSSSSAFDPQQHASQFRLLPACHRVERQRPKLHPTTSSSLELLHHLKALALDASFPLLARPALPHPRRTSPRLLCPSPRGAALDPLLPIDDGQPTTHPPPSFALDLSLFEWLGKEWVPLPLRPAEEEFLHRLDPRRLTRRPGLALYVPPCPPQPPSGPLCSARLRADLPPSTQTPHPPAPSLVTHSTVTPQRQLPSSPPTRPVMRRVSLTPPPPPRGR